MRGIITTDQTLTAAELTAKVAAVPSLTGFDFPRTVAEPESEILENNGQTVVLLNFGAKANIARSLHKLGCKVITVPGWTTAEEIMAYRLQESALHPYSYPHFYINKLCACKIITLSIISHIHTGFKYIYAILCM